MHTHASHARTDEDPSSRAGLERRRHLRVPLTAAVHLSSKDNFYAGKALDISEGGLFIETTAALEMGAEIAVRLQILDRTFVVSTEVCWVLQDRALRHVGVGVRFAHVPGPMRQAIAAFMQSRRPIGFEIHPQAPAPPPLRQRPPREARSRP